MFRSVIYGSQAWFCAPVVISKMLKLIPMEHEIWRPVVHHEGRYEVSNLGRVKSLIRFVRNLPVEEHLLAPNLSCRYPRVTLGKRPFRKSPGIHQLVTAAFLGPCPEGKQVNHK